MIMMVIQDSSEKDFGGISTDLKFGGKEEAVLKRKVERETQTSIQARPSRAQRLLGLCLCDNDNG